jgi:hypothetical protein
MRVFSRAPSQVFDTRLGTQALIRRFAPPSPEGGRVIEFILYEVVVLKDLR